jgi:Polysaccharide pyruvyl transferase
VIVPGMSKKALVAGWFSFEQCGATAGDLLARDLTRVWLEAAGYGSDVAVADPFTDGVAWDRVAPDDYQLLVFVCGPFGEDELTTRFLARFRGIPTIGLNLSMLQDLDEWMPFDALVERDSDRHSRPDMTFLSTAQAVPVVGLVLVHEQLEYPERMHATVGAAIERLLDQPDIVRVPIDTRLDTNGTALRTPREVESLIARMDAVVTTRLHGTVLALKNGVPALVIDPVAGGRKVARQARTIGWDVVFTADDLDDVRLAAALDLCLSPDGRAAAASVRDRAIAEARVVHDDFLEAVGSIERARGTRR